MANHLNINNHDTNFVDRSKTSGLYYHLPGADDGFAAHFAANSARVDALYSSVVAHTTVDMLIYIHDLNTEVDIEAIFSRFESTKDTHQVLRGREKYGRATIGEPQRKRRDLEFKLICVACGHNKIAGFDVNKMSSRLAYILYQDGEEQSVLSERSVEHRDKKFLNIGIKGELRIPETGEVLSVTMQVWSRGFLRIILGMGKKCPPGSPLKVMDRISSAVAWREEVYAGLAADAARLLWKHALSRGIKKNNKNNNSDTNNNKKNKRPAAPGRRAWKLNNNSFKLALSRPWSVEWPTLKQFKVHTSLVLSYNLLEDRDRYEGGYVMVNRIGREDESDTYFMLDIVFVPFNMLFKRLSVATRESSGGGIIKLNGFSIDPAQWKLSGKEGATSTRGARKALEALDGVVFKSGSLSLADNKLRARHPDGDRDVELLVRVKGLPVTVIKVYQGGKVQVNSLAPQHPWQTLWSGMEAFVGAMTRKGVPRGLFALAEQDPANFAWLAAVEGPPAVAVVNDNAAPSSHDNNNDKNDNNARVKRRNGVALGRRGRKAKAEEGHGRTTTCAPREKAPVPNTFGGGCGHLLDAAMKKGSRFVVKPNKHGDPCCYKFAASRPGAADKVLEAYRAQGIPVPGTVLEELGYSPSFREKATLELEKTNIGRTRDKRGMVIAISPKNGKLVIDGKSSMHTVRDLESTAAMLGIPTKYENKRKIYPKSKAQLARDIGVTALVRDGVPEFDGPSRLRALQNLASLVMLKVPDPSPTDHPSHVASVIEQAIIDLVEDKKIKKQQRAAAVAAYKDIIKNNNNNNKNGGEISSDEEDNNNDDDGKNNDNDNDAGGRKGRYGDENTNIGEKLGPFLKQYLVLDSLFGFTSFDIPDAVSRM
jgi:hypothetical protein